MSTKTKKKTGLGLVFLPLLPAIPVAAAAAAALGLAWPAVNRALNLLIRLAVRP